ncbi:hypothetical protein B0H63DRAFT_420026 [Podospora didyma]|uniref:Smr domain-containing protein n=1 Tax=Podospora didyma TaxID=330526 RepID=A0AAE0KET7_9PEZI|nr:hypothetical protein B0H63DRAFT_420026 [Podospora didyma]
MASSAIPMSRVGGRAFNHSAGADAEAEYDRLRDLARAAADRKKSCFDRAHQAYENGDRAEAKELSDEGKRHQKQQDAYNKQASEYIFRENNAPGRVAEDTIDLHGQFVEEAEDILEARIRDAQARGQKHLHVIVGKGNHSDGRVQKIKPRVEHVCQSLGLDYATEGNQGRIYVDLTGDRVHTAPPLPSQPSGYQSGHAAGSGYSGGQQQNTYHPPQGANYQQGHQQQQHHHQQQNQQQNQQGDDIGEVVGKLLPRLFKKLDCCVVM